MRLTSENRPKIDRISCGVISIDDVLGGGFPVGRISEVYGNQSAGKSTICLQAVIEAQQMGLECVYIDAEHALDIDYISSMGVDIDRLCISQPSHGEQALGITEAICKTGQFGLIVIDSVAALVPLKELEGEWSDANMGLHARLMGQAMRRLVGQAAKSDTTIIFINQIRTNLAVMYGNKNVTTGGNALKFWASIRLELTAVSKKHEDNDKNVLGYDVNIVCRKNRTAPPLKKTTVPLIYGIGFDARRDAVNIAIKKGTIKRSGGWYNIGEDKYHGLDELLEVDCEKLKELANVVL